MRTFYQHQQYPITAELRPLTNTHTHMQTLSITQFCVISNLKYGNGRCICARSSLKTTTPSAMNPFRKRHTDDKMCQIARVVVVVVFVDAAAVHFGAFNVFIGVCVRLVLLFVRCWSSSSIVGPPRKKQKLERIRLYFCQSFGWFFGWQNTNARYYFHFKWIYWLVLGEPTRIYGRLTYSILTVRRIVWWVFVETWDGRLWRRHETPNLKQTRERVDAIVLVSLQRIISGQSIFIKQHLPNNVINIEHDRWPNRWRRARDDSYQ